MILICKTKQGGRIKADNLDEDSKRTIYFDGSGAWLYTVSLNSFDLVDSGKHLDWGGNTKYASQVPDAARVWNSHKSGIIRKDMATARQDVVFRDDWKDNEIYPNLPKLLYIGFKLIPPDSL